MPNENEFIIIRNFLSKQQQFEEGIKKPRTLNKYAQLLSNYVGLENLNGFNHGEEIIKFVGSLNASLKTKKLIYYAIRKWFLLKDNKQIAKEMKDNKPKFAKSGTRTSQFLTLNQVLDLLSFCRNNKEKLICEFFICTGIRPSILLNLKKENLRFDINKIFIPSKITGNKSNRDLYVDLPIKLSKKIKKLTENISKDEYVFNLWQKDKINEYTRLRKLYDLIQKTGKRAGIENLSPIGKLGPMNLRHTFGVIHYNAYKDILRTRDAMGHKSSVITEVYAVSFPGWENEAKRIIEEGFD